MEKTNSNGIPSDHIASVDPIQSSQYAESFVIRKKPENIHDDVMSADTGMRPPFSAVNHEMSHLTSDCLHGEIGPLESVSKRRKKTSTFKDDSYCDELDSYDDVDDDDSLYIPMPVEVQILEEPREFRVNTRNVMSQKCVNVDATEGVLKETVVSGEDEGVMQDIKEVKICRICGDKYSISGILQHVQESHESELQYIEEIRKETVVLPLLCEDPLPVISWLKEHGLLKHEMKCQSCLNLMRWSRYSKIKDGYTWKCQTKYCQKYKATISIRKGSFFANSNMSLQQWVHVIYLWSECTGETLASRQVKISEKTMIDCYSFFREVCTRHFQAYPIQLGGPGIIVEIDETLFSHAGPKRNQGQVPQAPIWVFGIVDTSINPTIGYMEIVQARDAATILPIIQAVVRPGSIIHSDDRSAYCSIPDVGYTHRTVNHSQNSIEVDGNVHIQTIKSYWNKHKSHIKMSRGCKRDFMNSYLQEFMWHDRYSQNAFETFCKHISLQYPL